MAANPANGNTQHGPTTAMPPPVRETTGPPYHAMTVDNVLSELRSSQLGLRRTEAQERLDTVGPNRLTPGHSRTIWHILWEQLINIVTIILMVAAIIAAVYGDWIEFGFIAAVIVANIVIGVVQEGRAEAATRALAVMATTTATVLRNEKKVEIDAVELVPGDIVFLTAGDRVPADLRFIKATDVRVVEAALTGESSAVHKTTLPVAQDAVLGDRSCIGFLGTLVISGDSVGIVCATGDRTELGKISTLVSRVKTVRTPLQQQMATFGIILSVGCIIVVIVSLLVARFAQNFDTEESLEIAVAVAVALIPEALPTVVTITLALGVQEMARNKAIIRQLPAVETLGAVTCICSDKTGTLTRNEMTAVLIFVKGAVYRVTGSGCHPYGSIHRRAGTKHLLSSRVVADAAASATDSEAIPMTPMHDGAANSGSQPAAGADSGTLRRTETSASHPSVHLNINSGETVENDPRVSLSHEDEEGQRLAELLLPAALCNDANLMPTISAEAYQLLQSQPLGLPYLTESAEATMTATMISVPGVNPAAGLPPLPDKLEWCSTGDPTESALLTLVMKAGLNYRTLRVLQQAAPRVASLPFSSENKFMATINELPGPGSNDQRTMLYVKGAFDVLLERCATQAAHGNPWESEPIKPEMWKRANEKLASQGMRVLALCQRQLEQPPSAKRTHTLNRGTIMDGPPQLQINTLVAIVDPPRDSAISAVKSCHAAGVNVKMITGDHAATARAVAEWIGIGTAEVLTGPELEAMSDDTLEEHAETCNVYARASPEHKLRIVRALQRRRHVVAMTGDGVNDAPALRQANVGVAMGVAGTEVAKEASRMVLQDDNFATIEVAVRLGRSTYDNLRKLLMFLMPTTIAQGFSVALAVYIGIDPPLTHIQILFVNLVTAATLGLVLAAEGPENDIMRRPPRVPDKPLLDHLIIWRMVYVGGLMIAAMLGQVEWTKALNEPSTTPAEQEENERRGHTMALNTLVFAQCMYCFACRFLTRTALTPKIFLGNRMLMYMTALNVALQVIITYTPGVQNVWETTGLTVVEWLRILLFAFIIFFCVEAEKWYRLRHSSLPPAEELAAAGKAGAKLYRPRSRSESDAGSSSSDSGSGEGEGRAEVRNAPGASSTKAALPAEVPLDESLVLTPPTGLTSIRSPDRDAIIFLVPSEANDQESMTQQESRISYSIV